MTIRLYIAEDQMLVRSALRALFSLDADFEVIGDAADGRSALFEVLECKPDLVLADVEMPELTGLELATELKRRGFAGKFVIVTSFGRAGYVRRALDAGVSAFLLKDAPFDELVASLKKWCRGRKLLRRNWL